MRKMSATVFSGIDGRPARIVVRCGVSVVSSRI